MPDVLRGVDISTLNPHKRTSVTFCSYDKPGNVGGPFSWICQLLPALRSRGIDCECLFLTHFGGTGPGVETLKSAGFPCHVIDCQPRMADQVRWILERLKENPPDVFVPNLVVAAYHASSYVKAAGIPTIGILHSDDDYYQAIQDEFVFRKTANRLTDLVVVSRELEQHVNARRPQQTQLHRIPYGVQIPTTSTQHSDKRFRIAYVGRLAEEQKQISLLTRSLIKVCKRIPEAEAVIFGDGPDRSNVERILAQEGQGAAVRLMGPVPNQRIQSELLKCDVFTLLSDYEGLPIALLEAMACGCVPVCLNMRSGIPELIQHGTDGLIVDNRDTAFLDAVSQLHKDHNFRACLGNAARQKVTENYSDQNCFGRWAELLKTSAPDSVGTIKIPRRIRLAPRNPALESETHRKPAPSRILHALRRLRITAGRIRRKLI